MKKLREELKAKGLKKNEINKIVNERFGSVLYKPDPLPKKTLELAKQVPYETYWDEKTGRLARRNKSNATEILAARSALVDYENSKEVMVGKTLEQMKMEHAYGGGMVSHGARQERKEQNAELEEEINRPEVTKYIDDQGRIYNQKTSRNVGGKIHTGTLAAENHAKGKRVTYDTWKNRYGTSPNIGSTVRHEDGTTSYMSGKPNTKGVSVYKDNN